jgi:hypothetical protein
MKRLDRAAAKRAEGKHVSFKIASAADTDIKSIPTSGSLKSIGSPVLSHSLQALKKQGRVRIRGGKWMLPKGRSKPASA